MSQSIPRTPGLIRLQFFKGFWPALCGSSWGSCSWPIVPSDVTPRGRSLQFQSMDKVVEKWFIPSAELSKAQQSHLHSTISRDSISQPPALPSAEVAFYSLQAPEMSSPLLRVWKANCHTKKCLFLKTQWKVSTQPGLPWDLCSPPVMWQEEQTKECKSPRSPSPPRFPRILQPRRKPFVL